MTRIYVVSTARLTERQQAFRAANGHLNGYEFFYGVDRRELQGNERVLRRVDLKTCDWSPSSIATSLTHMEIWENIAVDDKNAIVFEDDAHVSANFHASIDLLHDSLAPGWDIVLLGYNFDAFAYLRFLPTGFGVAKVHLNQTALIREFDKIPQLRYLPKLHRLQAAWGVCGYLLSPKGAGELLRRIPRLETKLIAPAGVDWRIHAKSIDGLMNGCYAEMDSYLCMPPVVFVKNDPAGTTQDQKI